MEILNRLIDRWEIRLSEYNKQGEKEFASELAMCLRELKMELTAKSNSYQSATLDSICHFKKYKGCKWKDIIEDNPDYVEWCINNIVGFKLDEDAHKYLVEIQKGVQDDYEDLKF